MTCACPPVCHQDCGCPHHGGDALPAVAPTKDPYVFTCTPCGFPHAGECQRYETYGPEDLPPGAKYIYLRDGEVATWPTSDIRILRRQWDPYGCRLWYLSPEEPTTFFPDCEAKS